MSSTLFLPGLFGNCMKLSSYCKEFTHMINCDTVTFFGHLLTKDGMKPDPKKVKDIQEWPAPKDMKLWMMHRT